MKIAVVGGGAAGFFLSGRLKRLLPEARVVLIERSSRVLAKVKVSGGGRCNLTNSFAEVSDLCHVYPRGHKLMKRLLREFSHEDAYRWFEAHGVPLTTQDDECVFPQSQNSESVILCLRREAEAAGVEVRTGCPVIAVRRREGEGLLLVYDETGERNELFDRVAITTGGAPRGEGHNWLSALGHKIEKPCPSLYTFNINTRALTLLMGIVVENAMVGIAGTKYRAEGALLITHWGLSGPAVLRLSSYAARHMNENNYNVPLLVNWTGETNVEKVAEQLRVCLRDAQRRQMSNLHPFGLQNRLWLYLLERAGIASDKTCCELGSKGLNRLVHVLTSDSYEVAGKGAFREEFVTCGGVSLESVSMRTLESKVCPGLYFAGEVLDIDAVTGGFNFQAAWTTAYVAAGAIAASLRDREAGDETRR